MDCTSALCHLCHGTLRCALLRFASLCYAKIGWPSSPKYTGMPVRKEWVRAMAICAASRASCGGVGTARSGRFTQHHTRGRETTRRHEEARHDESPPEDVGFAIGIGCDRDLAFGFGTRLDSPMSSRMHLENVWISVTKAPLNRS
jgi:hypothetical protein